jgi:D-sedoheptulose 7-phosphate isomerase
MSQESSFLAALERHRATFAMLEQHREQAEQLLALTRRCLTTDSSILTAHANDYEFASVFERQVRGLGRPGDLVVGLTTSGESENVNRALIAANNLGAVTVALTGRDGGRVRDIAQLTIIIPSNETARIQEAHMFIGHWLCEALDEVAL